MANINIGTKNKNDPHYRYKMPSLVIKNTGKGNGIKTELTNINDIAKSLDRDTKSIMKFFAYELGTIVNGLIINGKFDENTLNNLLEKFITKFVSCNICDNPETIFVIRKKILQTECKACGERCDIDIKHRLTDYLLKNI